MEIALGILKVLMGVASPFIVIWIYLYVKRQMNPRELATAQSPLGANDSSRVRTTARAKGD
jgi:hypothetical protein